MLAHIVVDIDPFVVHFPKNWWIEGIRWYGILYIVSFFLVQFFLKQYSRKGISVLNEKQNDALVLWFAIGAVAGGRLGYCLFYDFWKFIEHPWIVCEIWRGGMSSHGGFLGAIIAILWFAKKFQQDAFKVADLLSSIIPLCLMFGRLGNFINAELVGRVTDRPWGVMFEHANGLQFFARHPSQLYEAFFEGLLPFIILQILIHRKSLLSGMISGVFLILYSLGRIGCEFFREPDAPLIGPMTRGQFFSIFLLGLGIILIFVRSGKKVRKNIFI